MVDNVDGFVHIVLCVHDKTGNYCKRVSATILSILRNTTSSCDFHIVCDETMSVYNQDKLEKTVGFFSESTISFHKLDSSDYLIKNEKLKQFTVGSLYRLDIQNILGSLDKVIYIDSDIIANCDIGELWDIDISDYLIAGVHDVCFDNGIKLPDVVSKGIIEKSKYINSGMLVMNLKLIREEFDLMQVAQSFFANNPNTAYPDQDAINYICRDRVLLLDEKWNTLTRYQRNNPHGLKNVFYHYTGWDNSFSNPTEIDILRLKFMGETAYGSEPAINELYSGIYSAYYKVEQLQQLLKAISDGKKKRIFWGYNSVSMDYITSLIPLREQDYYVGEDVVYDKDGMRFGVQVKDFKAICEEQIGTYIVLLLPQLENGTVISKLEGIGLRKSIDFFVIPALVTVEQGGYL